MRQKSRDKDQADGKGQGAITSFDESTLISSSTARRQTPPSPAFLFHMNLDDALTSPALLSLALTSHVRLRAEPLPSHVGHRARTRTAPLSHSHTRLFHPLRPTKANPRFPISPHLPTLLESLTMLAAPVVDITFDDGDDWIASPAKPRLYRTASVGNSWGVTSIGRGFNWSNNRKPDDVPEAIVSDPPDRPEPVASGSFISTVSEPESPRGTKHPPRPLANAFPRVNTSYGLMKPYEHSPVDDDKFRHAGAFTAEPAADSTPIQRTSSSRSIVSLTSTNPETFSSRPSSSKGSRPPLSRSPTAPRPRRRSSQQRVSLIAGRLSIVQLDPPTTPPDTSPKLMRFGSSSSFSSVISASPPAPPPDGNFIGGRSIAEFVIEGELGRGAYGLVKRAREMLDDGKMGVSISSQFMLGGRNVT